MSSNTSANYEKLKEGCEAIDAKGDVTIAVLLVDELDASNAGEFKRDMAPILETSTQLVLDLGRLRCSHGCRLRHQGRSHGHDGSTALETWQPRET